ncbi:MAG: F510_1955 family glycosylhydrolase [Rhodoglobus sp.]
MLHRNSNHAFLAGSGLAVILSATLLLTGCTTASTVPTASPAADAPFQHVHELQPDERDGTLLVATHDGLYRLTVGPDGDSTAAGPVGGLDFDPMGFAVADGVAYASGHPGPTTPDEFGSPNLGLITSTDLGETWNNVSLTGETDFHALTVMTDGGGSPRVFGIDSSSQNLQRSLDGGLTWSDGAELVARDILAAGDVLYATTAEGLAASMDDGATFTVDTSAPALYLLAADSTGALAGVDTAGRIWVDDAAGTWTMGGAVTGMPQALATDGERVYVADDRGISFTENAGATWVVVTVVA